MKPAVRPWSGDAYRTQMLEAAQFDPKYLRRAVKRTVEALEAQTPGGEPDHRVRLQAAKQLCDMAGIQPAQRATIEATFHGPVEITWKAPEPSKSLPPSPTNGLSTSGSNGTTSSSATGDSGRPSWL